MRVCNEKVMVNRKRMVKVGRVFAIAMRGGLDTRRETHVSGGVGRRASAGDRRRETRAGGAMLNPLFLQPKSPILGHLYPETF